MINKKLITISAALCLAIGSAFIVGTQIIPAYDTAVKYSRLGVEKTKYWWHVAKTPLPAAPETAKLAYLPPVFNGSHILGRSADGKKEVLIPIDLNDSIGSVYACFDILQDQFGKSCGTCFVPPGSLDGGRNRGLARRKGKDQNCWVGIQKRKS